MRLQSLLGAAALLGLAALFTAQATAGPSLDARSERDLIRKGFKIAPVKLNLKNKNRDQVGLGSYLVNSAGDCNGCHTNPSFAAGGNPFNGEPEVINTANYLAGGQQFGPFVSANITPDATGKPAGLTYAQFLRTLRTGQNPHDTTKLLQVMPWPAYRKMTDHQIRAVYEYLRAIPHAEPAPPQ
jgi:hypothetical protein